MIETKLSDMQYGGTMEEVLRGSVFGTFGSNYNKFKNFKKKQSMETFDQFLYFFARNEDEPQILYETMYRALLYFNLPETVIHQEIKP